MTDINSEAQKPDSIENEVRQHILHFEADILIYILEIYEEIKKEKSPYHKE